MLLRQVYDAGVRVGHKLLLVPPWPTALADVVP